MYIWRLETHYTNRQAMTRDSSIGRTPYSWYLIIVLGLPPLVMVKEFGGHIATKLFIFHRRRCIPCRGCYNCTMALLDQNQNGFSPFTGNYMLKTDWYVLDLLLLVAIVIRNTFQKLSHVNLRDTHLKVSFAIFVYII